MKNLFVLMFLAVLCVGTVFAQPAATKAAAASGTALVSLPIVSSSSGTAEIVPCTGTGSPAGCTCGAWTTILTTSIIPPGGKDLFLGVSAQTGLFTASLNNNVASGTTITNENVSIRVRVQVDGVNASPGVVTFDNLIRQTTQIATADSLALVLNEGGARSFNFIKTDVGVGPHTINVQKQFCWDNFFSATGAGSTATSSLRAVIGPRTLTVEQVILDAQ